ncbi:hypothetical protein L202_04915 [Cryptococcus amylolentus CBS 6039]|uniref:Uncharacterized protein n=1 Tax=Cryptococcus amylolentus CBS 6039 TaxID=1295533 RepID=A0A1E3HN62_9TREE|nr:hypothetical protein L202_04915 [Cryptococcus amylolentus CBS 6039]ODN77789.1 hypothetical protein L202_04915 [Cryptococcus amylolentus CBS 6039]
MSPPTSSTEHPAISIPWKCVLLCRPMTYCKGYLILRGSSRPPEPDPTTASVPYHSLGFTCLPLLHAKWVRAVAGQPRHCTYKWHSVYYGDPYATDAQSGQVRSTLYIETRDEQVTPKGDDLRLVLPHERGYLGLLTDSRPDFADVMKQPLPKIKQLGPKSWREEYGVYTFASRAMLVWRDDQGVERESVVDVRGESRLSLEFPRGGVRPTRRERGGIDR